MTDKIKLKADKFVNDKKLKLNYIKPKDLKLLLAEFCEEQIAELKKELEAEKQLNAEIKARFVKCNTCTDEMKSKCLMFSENLCEGERCEELVDLMGLISKSELEESFNKAKELLESCVCIINRLTPTTTLLEKNERSLLKQAEQFIKDSEVEK